MELDTANSKVTAKVWLQIQEAVNSRNKAEIQRIGKTLASKPLVQEGTTPEELAKQILDLAPGNHPQLGELLLQFGAVLPS